MLFIMRGATCSGKDTFINNYFESSDSPHVVSSDRFRLMLFGSISIQRQNKKVFEVIHEVIEARISAHVSWTVYNASNLKMTDCNKVIEICKKYKTPYTFISLEPPSVDILFDRAIGRGLGNGLYVSLDSIEKQVQTYHNCTKYFIEEAVNSKLCSFIEIDQDYEVLKHVD